jgi:hypothetical protein
VCVAVSLATSSLFSSTRAIRCCWAWGRAPEGAGAGAEAARAESLCWADLRDEEGRAEDGGVDEWVRGIKRGGQGMVEWMSGCE